MSERNPRAHGAHPTDDELLDLVNGFLEDAERLRIVSHARSCASCDARLREFVGAHERARALAPGMLAGASPAAVAGEGGVRTLPAPSVARRRGVRTPALLLAAAALVVVAGSVFLLRSPGAPTSPASRARNAWLPQGIASGARRSSLNAHADSVVTAGVAAYDRRDLAKTAEILAEPLERGGLEWVRRLYLANTLVALGRPREALPVLEVRDSEYLPEPWRGEWMWTHLVALSKCGRQASADSLLGLLRQRSDEVGARARALSDAPRDAR